jgi:glycosyltransferase involved in cell wall biosynthesis
MKVAMISNYNESCGVASYAGALVKGLRQHGGVQLDVIPIDTGLARSQLRHLRAAKKRHFREIAEKAAAYDAVNVQFENGLFGNSDREVLRHLRFILERCRNVSITMHTADFGYLNPGRRGLSWFAIFMLRRQFYLAREALGGITRPFMHKLMPLLRKYNPALIVHTKREQRIFQKFYGIENVHVHPLAFLDAPTREGVRGSVSDDAFRDRYSLDPADRVFALYGFISEYKGHMTALHALRHLPENYKLIVVGGQHPGSVMRHEQVNLYIQQLLDTMEGFRATGEGKSLSITHDEASIIADRVRFAGMVDDDELLRVMAHADVNVFPYVETGQSGSGPASLALEVGSRCLMSRAFVFNELASFAPGDFDRFDIGNYLELAQKIRAMVEVPLQRDNAFNRQFSLESNVRFHIDLMRRGAK